MQHSLTRRGLLYLHFFLVILVYNSRSNAQRNVSQCLNNYCYFWNGNVSTYKELEPCPEPHWDLEIYGQKVQRGIIQFIKHLKTNGGDTIIGSYIPLNLNCTNSTTCAWKFTNRAAKYLNWDNHMKWNSNNAIYYFRANTTNGTTKWNSIQLAMNSRFARLCMKSNGSTEANGEVYTTIAVAVVAMIIVVLIGVLLVVLRKKLRRNKCTIDEIQQQQSSESGKPIYAEVLQAAGDNFNQNQTSMQYADLNWSTNISEIQQNDSKPVEDQKTNYFGPMGDVYARV